MRKCARCGYRSTRWHLVKRESLRDSTIVRTFALCEPCIDSLLRVAQPWTPTIQRFVVESLRSAKKEI